MKTSSSLLSIATLLLIAGATSAGQPLPLASVSIGPDGSVELPSPRLRSLVREAFSDGANEALVQQTGITEECCRCPAADSDYVLNTSVLVRAAVEQEFPKKWFLVEGTLIAALRYGAHVHRLNSGKLNWVDFDFDFVIMCPPEERDAAVFRLMTHLPGWTNHTRFDDIVKITAPDAKLSSKSCSGGGPLDKQYADLHFLDLLVDLDGTTKLFSPKKQAYLWTRWITSESRSNLELPQNLVLPLQKVQWGGSDAYAPHAYLEVLQLWQNGEYSKSPLWKPIEQSMATAGRFKCLCSLDKADEDEICEGFSNLKKAGFETFDCSA